MFGSRHPPAEVTQQRENREHKEKECGSYRRLSRVREITSLVPLSRQQQTGDRAFKCGPAGSNPLFVFCKSNVNASQEPLRTRAILLGIGTKPREPMQRRRIHVATRRKQVAPVFTS